MNSGAEEDCEEEDRERGKEEEEEEEKEEEGEEGKEEEDGIDVGGTIPEETTERERIQTRSRK